MRGPGCAGSARAGILTLCLLALLSAGQPGGRAQAADVPLSHLDETPRLGIVSAFGAEADLLQQAMQERQEYVLNGNRFTTGRLQGVPVVLVLTGVSLVNASMTTQLLIDRFRLSHLLLSGIAGGIDPDGRVGDVTAPERWALPLEAWWGKGLELPSPCGTPGDLACLGLRLAGDGTQAWPEFALPLAGEAGQGTLGTGLRMRETQVRRSQTGLAGEFRFSFPADPDMLAVARTLRPALERCGPRGARQCVSAQPQLQVGGLGVSVPLFLANADYRRYLSTTLQARVLDMETAAVAQVAYANGVPFLGLRSISDLAGGGPNGDVGALFSSGLAESNAARVTLAFVDAWSRRNGAAEAPASPVMAPARRAIKVLILTLFAPEAAPWREPLALRDPVPVPGLPTDNPALLCNADQVCLATLGMGHANAAASMMAIVLDPELDLRQTWFLVAGIAGIDPAQGTLGSAAWARFLVDFGLAHELDARDMPKDWPGGHLGILTRQPGEKPRLEYHSEIYALDPALQRRALELSQGVALADSPAAARYRAHYREPAARAAPSVLACDTLAGDTWWHGAHLGEQARRWVSLLSDGQGRYCTTQQEDNATAAALARGAALGRLDFRRLAVLRTGANFDRPYPGQSAAQSLRADSGGFAPALENLYRVGNAVVRDIVQRWPEWAEGVPPR